MTDASKGEESVKSSEPQNPKSGRSASIPAPLLNLLDKLGHMQRRAIERGFQITVTNVRESLFSLTRTFVTKIPSIPLVIDSVIQGRDYPVPIRIYHPDPDRPLPVALFVHGGGHVAGSVDLYDPLVRKLAAVTNRVMVSIEYRRAPEYPYPAGLEDTLVCAGKVFPALTALSLPHEHSLAVVGDSGGGALCATVSQISQFNPGLCIEKQVLIYPSLDYTLSHPSVDENAEGYLLEREKILWMFETYLQHAEDRRAISPLFMEVTSSYPATLVITAGFDPLRDEGIHYVNILKDAGIDTAHLHLPGMVHAFLNLEDLAEAACMQTYEAIGKFLGAAPG